MTTFINILPKLRYFEGRDYIQIGTRVIQLFCFPNKPMKSGAFWISRKGRIFETWEGVGGGGGGGGGVHLEKEVYDPPYQLWRFLSAVVTRNYRNQGQRPRNWENGIGSQHCGEVIINIMTL